MSVEVGSQVEVVVDSVVSWRVDDVNRAVVAAPSPIFTSADFVESI